MTLEIHSQLTGFIWSICNLSKLDFPRLLEDPDQLAPNLTSNINAFSPNVREIMAAATGKFDVRGEAAISSATEEKTC
jgi:hypothetical protein